MAFPTGPRNLSLRAVGPPQVQRHSIQGDNIRTSSGGAVLGRIRPHASRQLKPSFLPAPQSWQCRGCCRRSHIPEEPSSSSASPGLEPISGGGKKPGSLASGEGSGKGRPAVLCRAACPAQGLRSLPQGSAPAPAHQQPWPAGASSGIRPLTKAALRSYKRTAAGGFWPCLPTPVPAGSLGASSLWTVDTS